MRVNRSLFYLNTSLIAYHCLWERQHELLDPIEKRKEVLSRSLPSLQPVSSWGFSAWKEGLNVRYSVFMAFVLISYIFLMFFGPIENYKTIESSLSNAPFLFQGDFSGLELDGRIIYSCSPHPQH